MNAKGTPAPPVGLADTVGNAWRVMADRLTRSWTSAPHFYLTREVSAARLVEWREQLAPANPPGTPPHPLILYNSRGPGTDPPLTSRRGDSPNIFPHRHP